MLKDQSGFDLIKIDTQGSELNILKGSIEIVEKTKFLLLELSVVEYNFNAPTYLQVIKYLEENNFKLIDIFDFPPKIIFSGFQENFTSGRINGSEPSFSGSRDE